MDLQEQKFNDQLKEEYIDSDYEKQIDAAVEYDEIPEDTDDQIEAIAHICRMDYLRELEDSAPDIYLKGVIGQDGYIGKMIEKEQPYEQRD